MDAWWCYLKLPSKLRGKQDALSPGGNLYVSWSFKEFKNLKNPFSLQQFRCEGQRNSSSFFISGSLRWLVCGWDQLIVKEVARKLISLSLSFLISVCVCVCLWVSMSLFVSRLHEIQLFWRLIARQNIFFILGSDSWLVHPKFTFASQGTNVKDQKEISPS